MRPGAATNRRSSTPWVSVVTTPINVNVYEICAGEKPWALTANNGSVESTTANDPANAKFTAARRLSMGSRRVRRIAA